MSLVRLCIAALSNNVSLVDDVKTFIETSKDPVWSNKTELSLKRVFKYKKLIHGFDWKYREKSAVCSLYFKRAIDKKSSSCGCFVIYAGEFGPKHHLLTNKSVNYLLTAKHCVSESENIIAEFKSFVMLSKSLKTNIIKRPAQLVLHHPHVDISLVVIEHATDVFFQTPVDDEDFDDGDYDIVDNKQYDYFVVGTSSYGQLFYTNALRILNFKTDRTSQIGQTFYTFLPVDTQPTVTPLDNIVVYGSVCHGDSGSVFARCIKSASGGVCFFKGVVIRLKKPNCPYINETQSETVVVKADDLFWLVKSGFYNDVVSKGHSRVIKQLPVITTATKTTTTIPPATKTTTTIPPATKTTTTIPPATKTTTKAPTTIPPATKTTTKAPTTTTTKTTTKTTTTNSPTQKSTTPKSSDDEDYELCDLQTYYDFCAALYFSEYKKMRREREK